MANSVLANGHLSTTMGNWPATGPLGHGPWSLTLDIGQQRFGQWSFAQDHGTLVNNRTIGPWPLVVDHDPWPLANNGSVSPRPLAIGQRPLVRGPWALVDRVGHIVAVDISVKLIFLDIQKVRSQKIVRSSVKLSLI